MKEGPWYCGCTYLLRELRETYLSGVYAGDKGLKEVLPPGSALDQMSRGKNLGI